VREQHRRGAWATRRSIEARRASGSNCTGVVVGRMNAPRALASSRYERPKVSPVNIDRDDSSQTQKWWRAWPGVSRKRSGRPPSSSVKPSFASTIRDASTGTGAP